MAKHRISSVVMWSSYSALFILIMIWSIWLSPASRYPVPLAIAFGLLPLSIPLRGALRGRHRSIFWLSIVSLIYFFHGIGVSVSAASLNWIAVVESVLALLLCLGCWLSMRAIKQLAA
ncbi:MAG: DUF2069 domain-containing protein [Gammaproteobacteria bacterium]|nr:DUF2069 domain-containing protein [Gammaproteobacteria bacterium]